MKTPTCPQCQCHVFKIPVTQTITIEFFEKDQDGNDHQVIDGPEGDMLWDDGVEVECDQCGHVDILEAMK